MRGARPRLSRFEEAKAVWLGGGIVRPRRGVDLAALAIGAAVRRMGRPLLVPGAVGHAVEGTGSGRSGTLGAR